MLRSFVVGMMLVQGVGMWAGPAEASKPGPADGPCSRPWMTNISTTQDPPNVVKMNVISLIDCAEERWSVPGGLGMALCIADRESSYWPAAYNPSGAEGVYQQMRNYWVGRARAWLDPDWFGWQWKNIVDPDGTGAFNARANVLVSIQMMHTTGLGDWGGGC